MFQVVIQLNEKYIKDIEFLCDLEDAILDACDEESHWIVYHDFVSGEPRFFMSSNDVWELRSIVTGLDILRDVDFVFAVRIADDSYSYLVDLDYSERKLPGEGGLFDGPEHW